MNKKNLHWILSEQKKCQLDSEWTEKAFILETNGQKTFIRFWVDKKLSLDFELTQKTNFQSDQKYRDAPYRDSFVKNVNWVWWQKNAHSILSEQKTFTGFWEKQRNVHWILSEQQKRQFWGPVDKQNVHSILSEQQKSPLRTYFFFVYSSPWIVIAHSWL